MQFAHDFGDRLAAARIVVPEVAMHHVFYAGFCFDVPDRLAVALVQCAAALAAAGRLESIEVPAVFDAEVTRVNLLLGAGMPIATAPFLGGQPVIEGVDEALGRIQRVITASSSLT